MLDLFRLTVLSTLARTGSVTATARELGYAQPSISHHLSRLEAEVGLPLTQRAGRGIRLTPAGELLAHRAAEILGRVEAAEDELAALGGLRSGRVRVAGFQSALSSVVTTAAGSMRTSAPAIELTLQDLHPDLALQQLREGLIDVAVVFRYDDEVPDGLRFTHLFDDSMHLLSTEGGRTLEESADAPWIAGCENCRRELVSACAAAGFTPRIMYTSDDPVVQQSMVAAGLGVTTMPGLSVAQHRVPGVETTELEDLRRRVHVATYGEPPDPPATAAFVRAVVEASRALVGGPSGRLSLS
ncbi:LysR family transcriptional regulator [Phycicoccus sp. HDW14]|uniref:LysR family transcriptional regulator n=1 Tax=Phycicoccus sp. HDW14 TaxID=2714941 RepID=UPI00140A4751|nr:LysR family transcriptional regulator [Phycicoccus sp. HDW14]QIM21489.1 LysR family transcriptional regulator [Phycicoccus sp. HDW14]